MQYFVFCFFFLKLPYHSIFSAESFRSWKRVSDGVRCVFLMHLESFTSPHSNAVKFAEDLIKISRHIDKVLNA